MAAKESKYEGDELDNFVRQFCVSVSADDTARALNRILQKVEKGEPFHGWMLLGRWKSKLISAAKKHVYASRWSRRGVHPVLFGRILYMAQRGSRMTYSSYIIQAFFMRTRRMSRMKLQNAAKRHGVMMAIDERRQGKSGRYIDCDGSMYFFGVDKSQNWWQILTQKEWDKHTIRGASSTLNGTSAMVLRGQWSQIDRHQLCGKIRPLTRHVRLGSVGLAYWRVRKVSSSIDLTNPDASSVQDVTAHIDQNTGLWVSYDNRSTRGHCIKLSGSSFAID